MENPEQEIRAVVRSLCQGKPDEQRRTLEQYFTRDASFIHPFCIVPSFDIGHVPLLGPIYSRYGLLSIFQWYRMMSPKIEIEIDTVLYDRARDRLYLDIRQIFALWFVPFYKAPVRLVTVLDLVSNDDPNYHEPLSRLIDQQQGSGEKAEHQQHHASNSTTGGRRTWKISKQEDLYQVNEFLKFTGTSLLSAAWFLFQLGATIVCVFLALFLRMSPWNRQTEPARGGTESKIGQLDGAAFLDSDSKNSDIGDSKPESYRTGEKTAPEGGQGSHGGETGGATNGSRSGSTHSKGTSPSKSWKHQKKSSN